MFGKDARDVAAGAARREERLGGQERRVAAWIGASIVIEGNLTSSEDTTIAGRVEGDVSVREHGLVIAPTGRINGNIHARSVAVHGEVSGSIRAGGKLEIGQTGSVQGDITTPRLIVAEGATLQGQVGVGEQATALV
jgi:cytoskeletal protein CcmA (bactofilin family)